MSKVDWSKAPKAAEWYAHGGFWILDKDGCERLFINDKGWCLSHYDRSSKLADDYEPRPAPTQATSKVDWSTAPEGAEFYAVGFFYKNHAGSLCLFKDPFWVESPCQIISIFMQQDDYEVRPTIPVMNKAGSSKAPEGPPNVEFYTGCSWLKNRATPPKPSEQQFAIRGSLSDQPITISVKSPEWPDESRIDIVATNGNTGEHYEATELTTAADFLSAGLEILSQRGEQYGNDGRECSFPQAAEAFNALTGHKLKGSDVCLILALVKQARQYAQPGRFHEDSAVDAVNYLALQSELLKKERT